MRIVIDVNAMRRRYLGLTDAVFLLFCLLLETAEQAHNPTIHNSAGQISYLPFLAKIAHHLTSRNPIISSLPVSNSCRKATQSSFPLFLPYLSLPKFLASKRTCELSAGSHTQKHKLVTQAWPRTLHHFSRLSPSVSSLQAEALFWATRRAKD